MSIQPEAKVHPLCFHSPIYFYEFSFSSSNGERLRKQIFVDAFCLEHDLDAANLMDSDFPKAQLAFLDLLGAFFVADAGRKPTLWFQISGEDLA